MRIKKQIALCLSVFMVCLSSQNVFAFGSFNFGNTIKVAIISEEFGASGQRIGVSGHRNANDLKEFMSVFGEKDKYGNLSVTDGSGTEYKFQISSDIIYVDGEREKERYVDATETSCSGGVTYIYEYKKDRLEDVLKDKDIIVVIIDISLPRNKWQHKMERYAQRIWEKNRNICVMFVPSQNDIDYDTLNVIANFVSPVLEQWAFDNEYIDRQCVSFESKHEDTLADIISQVTSYKRLYRHDAWFGGCSIQ